jgi:hypothetical protein
MLLFEGNAALSGLLSLADDLDMLPNVPGVGCGAQVVEDELGARGADVVDAAGESNLLVLV